MQYVKSKKEFIDSLEKDERVNEKHWVKILKLLLWHRNERKLYIKNLSEEEKKLLDKLERRWKEKFIEEYLHDKILYSWNGDKGVKKKEYWYEDWKAWEVIMDEWIKLNLNW